MSARKMHTGHYACKLPKSVIFLVSVHILTLLARLCDYNVAKNFRFIAYNFNFYMVHCFYSVPKAACYWQSASTLIVCFATYCICIVTITSYYNFQTFNFRESVELYGSSVEIGMGGEASTENMSEEQSAYSADNMVFEEYADEENGCADNPNTSVLLRLGESIYKVGLNFCKCLIINNSFVEY